LNTRLLAGCDADLQRRITGRQETVGESFARERPLLRALPTLAAQTAEELTPRVDAKALVTVKQNRYSVPVALAGLKVCATVGAREIELRHGGERVASHERLSGRFGTSAQLDHYLELLTRKPAALRGSQALWQAREHGPARAELAVRGALAAGAHDGRAVAVLARRVERAASPSLSDLPERLRNVGLPEPSLTQYDQLLTGSGS